MEYWIHYVTSYELFHSLTSLRRSSVVELEFCINFVRSAAAKQILWTIDDHLSSDDDDNASRQYIIVCRIEEFVRPLLTEKSFEDSLHEWQLIQEYDIISCGSLMDHVDILTLSDDHDSSSRKSISIQTRWHHLTDVINTNLSVQDDDQSSRRRWTHYRRKSYQTETFAISTNELYRSRLTLARVDPYWVSISSRFMWWRSQ